MSYSYESIDALFEWAPEGALALVKQEISQLVRRDKAVLADAFYDYMMQDPNASPFLSVKAVEARLKPGLQKWLERLLCHDSEAELQAVLAMQRHVGEVHARAEIPLQLVARGMRLLKREICSRIVAGRLGRSETLLAIMRVTHLIDVAFEEMSAAFEHSHEHEVRTDEAYRMSAGSGDLLLERERQTSTLLDWESRLFRAMAMGLSLEGGTSLTSSAFGLWLNHKAALIFDNTRELPLIAECVARVDNAIFPEAVFARKKAPVPDDVRALIKAVTSEVEQIRFLLASMFERLTDLEVGRDVLTQLFNRRFLPTIMKREIELSRRKGTAFCVLLLDIDLFKQVNDRFGHESGDRVLQNVAGVLVGQVRASDFVFRYGGEEFLILLAEVDHIKACSVAEKIRRRIEASVTPLTDDQSVSVTASIGVAAHDGHPDFQHLVDRADKALYQAKAAGRNCTVLAES
ncbi:MAG: diguanylate cyclase [Betaproteobacteria bacterium HGW-Betaproteobacteria-13]|jgi:diguanylate cyclase|nr:MAG: diguanylate cyclase [Betaproteobacteria bacterium HGW-Betaproteobacteria-19]PKO80944.1 MAG: diguanylate cyclase [Betaproteobacteria bacterium HGW-Betaproteobacteria-13]